MAGRFLGKYDMHEAKRAEQIRNSRRKRDSTPPEARKPSFRHVVCGCGAKGCIFISNYAFF